MGAQLTELVLQDSSLCSSLSASVDVDCMSISASSPSLHLLLLFFLHVHKDDIDLQAVANDFINHNSSRQHCIGTFV